MGHAPSWRWWIAIGLPVALFGGVFLGTRVALQPARPVPTFGEFMQPQTRWAAEDSVRATIVDEAPAWGPSEKVRWDRADSFTFSDTPRSAREPGIRDGSEGGPPAEFVAISDFPKPADVSFRVHSKRFAIRYVSHPFASAGLWIDGRHVRLAGSETSTATRWIDVELPGPRAVRVRFAGPPFFWGVELPPRAKDTVRPVGASFTLGVVADSFYELTPGSAAWPASIALATLTGFRVWNMAAGGTGYLNDGTPLQGVGGQRSSPYGSAQRIAAVVDAPIDALLVSGSVNDVLLPSSGYADAVDHFLSEIARHRPRLPVVVLGIQSVRLPEWPVGFCRPKNRVLRRVALRHKNVVGFIDQCTHPWLTGSGSSAKPRGDGNQDRYLGPEYVHPNGAGQRHLQARLVRALRTLPAGLRPSGSDQ